MIEMKTCTKCNIEKPLTSEFFHKDKSKKDGFRSQCKTCSNEYKKNYRNNNRQTIREINRKLYNKNKNKYINKMKQRSKQHYINNKDNYLTRNRIRNIDFSNKYGITYRRLHEYIRKNKPIPEVCTICNEYKDLEACSIDHTYTKNLNDWIYLCSECHALFDKYRGEKDGI